MKLSEAANRITNIDDIEKNLVSQLVITPILENNQIGASSIDLRLGTEFKVAASSRSPLVGQHEVHIENFFQTTFREFGESFILYPNQFVLTNTLEYIKLPYNLVGEIYARSSLNRIGLNVSTYVQPGYTGTLTIQLENNGLVPINLTSGMRLVQLVLSETDRATELYQTNTESKYISNTSPVLSALNQDKDMMKLKQLFK